jgi:predicted XRE-type DNA-binding protein
MRRAKQNRLERAGWRVGSVREFLDLTDEELALVEIRVSLAMGVRNRRRRRKLTQLELAELMGSSQSRVAKMEAGDESVSMDLLVRALLALGATRKDVAKIVGTEAA